MKTKEESYLKSSIAYFIIIILGFVVYTNSLDGKFLWDDYHLVVNNAYIKNWSNIIKIFTEDIASGSAGKFYYYRPMQMVTYAINYSIWRLNVVGYHLTNIILHILTAIGVFCFINILFRDILVSLITSLFFLVHPLHTEAISYISGRADPLAALFIFLCLICYVRFLNTKKAILYVAGLLSYVLALLSRENSLLLPVILLLYHYVFKKKLKISVFLPVLGIASAYILVRLTFLENLLPPFVRTSSWVQRLPGFFVAVTNYLRLLIVPFNLHMEYEDIIFSLREPKAMMGIAILGFLLIYAFKKKESHNLFCFSILWFFLMLLPMSNLLYPMDAYMSEHWLYLPSLGFFLILAKFLAAFYRRQKSKVPAFVSTFVLVFFYSSLAMRQNIYWGEPLLLYERTVRYAPYSYVAHTLLGLEYKITGKTQEAVESFKKAIQLNPRYAEPYGNLGILYNNIGKKEEAIELYKKAIENNPFYPETYTNLGVVYNELGRKEEAIASYKKAIEVCPVYARAYNNLGILYSELGRHKDARLMFKKTIELDPDFPDAYNNLGVILYGFGERDEAIALFKRAIEINPSNKEANNNLARILSEKDQE